MKILTSILLGIALLTVNEVNGAAKKSANFSGKWEATASLPDGDTRESSLSISKKEGKLHATYVGQTGEERTFDRIKAEGKTLNIEFDMERDGQKGTVGVKAELNKEGGLVGNWYVQGEDGTEVMKSNWKAVRSASSVLNGKWDVVAVTTENNIEHEMVIKKSGSSFSGYADSDDGQLEYTKVSAKKNIVHLELPFAGGTVKVEAKLSQARKLVGKWTYFDDINEEAATGDWSATKQRRAKKQ